MARKKTSPFKRFAIIGCILIVAEAIFWFAFRESHEIPPAEWLEKQIAEKRRSSPDMSSEREAQLRVQVAVSRYQSENNGKPPPNLESLVGTYFDRVPIDPNTHKPFAYQILKGRAFVGSTENPAAKPNGDAEVYDGTVGQEAIDTTEQVAFVYDPTGKRDPFRPFDFSPKSEDSSKSPLEKYDIGQLKLTAVLKGFDEPMAIVENSVGKGFTVKKGTKIGTNNGEVVDILQDRLMILETETDFTGTKKTRTVEIKLRTKDQEKQ